MRLYLEFAVVWNLEYVVVFYLGVFAGYGQTLTSIVSEFLYLNVHTCA